MSNRGSVKKDASGRWCFVIDLPGDVARKQVRRRGFATKKEAQAALDKLTGDVALDQYVDPSLLTVGEYLEHHWLPLATSRVRPTTIDNYERNVRNHLSDLAVVRLQALDRRRVSQWVIGLSGKGLSPKSVRNCVGILGKALNDAVDLGLVGRNVAARLDAVLPKTQSVQPTTWTADQVGRFLSATADDRFGPIYRFIAMSQCRRGEAVGLRWRDLDLEASTATLVSQRTIAGGIVVEGAPKTKAGARTVALDPATLAALVAWRKKQAAERLMMGAGWPDHGLVFTNADGSPIWPQTITSTFRARCVELGLPYPKLHGLRHSGATLLIAMGVSPKVVQQRLGHAHVSVTLGLYSHVLPGHDRAAAETLAAAVDKVSVTNL